MKKYISIIIALLISIFVFIPASAEEVTAKPFNSVDGGTVWEVYDDELLSDYIISEDGLWEYQIVKKDNSALPYEYFGKNVTVLEIPEVIDGHPVTVKNRFICDSPCLSRIILPATIKEISNMYLDSRKKSNNTIFTVNLNEGLKKNK